MDNCYYCDSEDRLYDSLVQDNMIVCSDCIEEYAKQEILIEKEL